MRIEPSTEKPPACARCPIAWASSPGSSPRRTKTRNRRALQISIAMQEVAQPLRHCQHPLAHRQWRQDVIGEMGRRRHHAPAVARGADPATLAREGDQEVVAALSAAGAGDAMGKDAAVEVAAELPLHLFRHRPLVIVTVAALGEPGLEVLLDAAIEHAPARSARPILRRCAVLGLALDPHPCPLCLASRRWGSGWAAPCAGRHWCSEPASARGGQHRVLQTPRKKIQVFRELPNDPLPSLVPDS